MERDNRLWGRVGDLETRIAELERKLEELVGIEEHLEVCECVICTVHRINPRESVK